MWWSSWWLIWVVFMIMFMAAPVGYGWGYRGWGPPYPSYFQRRREQLATGAGRPPGYDHYAWGFGGDFVWIMLMVGVFWVFWGSWGTWGH